MGNTPVPALDIDQGLLELHEDPSYAQVDPLSEPQYMFDYAIFKLNDPDLVLTNHQMDVDQLEQYSRLASDIRGKFRAKAAEVQADELAENPDS